MANIDITLDMNWHKLSRSWQIQACQLIRKVVQKTTHSNVRHLRPTLFKNNNTIETRPDASMAVLHLRIDSVDVIRVTCYLDTL